MAKYTHALVVDGSVRQLFTEDPKLPAPLHVVNVSGNPKIAENWQVSGDGVISPPPDVVTIAPRAITYKADLYRRVTDKEAEAIEVALAAAPVRQRRLFESAQFIDAADPDTVFLREALVGMFGKDRADVLLASS